MHATSLGSVFPIAGPVLLEHHVATFKVFPIFAFFLHMTSSHASKEP